MLLDGGLTRLHEADDDAVTWLKTTAATALAKWNEGHRDRGIPVNSREYGFREIPAGIPGIFSQV